MKKSKIIYVGLIIFFSGYLTINYVNFKNENSLKKIEQALDTPKKAGSKKLIKTPSTQKIQDNQVKRYLAYDGGGFGRINSGIVKCLHDNVEIEIMSSNSPKNADILYFHMSVPGSLQKNRDPSKKQYYMVYGLESEVHSYGGDTWQNADFRMFYNLDKSFPEPATYFDVKMHLADLLSPPKVTFDKKENKVPIVWVVSNCNAYNGREKFMKELMTKIDVDSYGGCLKNKFNHPTEHMKGNIELFSNYKFAIAIENSNCEDYVTEKLVHAIASGSIPIVAGSDNKPDYTKFLPKNSYINIYDYETVDKLVEHLNKIASDPKEYEKYLIFKTNHNYTRQYLYGLQLPELISLAKEIIGPEDNFFKELVEKEHSDNKLCKIGSYLKNTPEDEVAKQIEKNRSERPSVNDACLKTKDLPSHFKIKT